MVILPQLIATVPPYYDDTYIKTEYVEICEEVGEEYNICPELLMALIEKESSGKADAQNGSCKGLCQVSEKWHSGRMEKLGVTDIYDPEGNIRLAADYLTELGAEYEDIAVVLGWFHGESDPENNISTYTTWILERSEELEKAHGK
jgi:soluble lytic murein transglycosylase-like protein